MVTFEVWTGKDDVEEFYKYKDFESRMIFLHKNGIEVRGYSLSNNENTLKYYYFRDDNLIAESNYMDN